MKRYAFIGLFVFVCSCLIQTPVSAEIGFKLENSTVSVGTFYNGTTVQASGTVPTGSDVVVVVSGEPEELHLKLKGKAAGFLWMNIGDLTLSNAPQVYMVYANADVGSLLKSAEMPFSLAALKNRIEMSMPETDKDKLFKEFIKLKEEESVYAVRPSAISLEKNGHFNLDLTLSPRMKQGDYTITTYAIQNGQITGTTTKTLTIGLTGFPAWISKMAFHNALVYGLLAVLIALAAGLLMGVLFKDAGDGAH